jgi:hypothetical protein
MEQRIKNIKEMSVAIDMRDDIFSDFDPRPFSDVPIQITGKRRAAD